MVAAADPGDAASFWRPHLRLRHRTGTVYLLAFLTARSQRSLLNSKGPARVVVVALVHCGGHFEGGTVLHWPGGANGKGALLTGDLITVVQDRRYVSFMRSYPN